MRCAIARVILFIATIVLGLTGCITNKPRDLEVSNIGAFGKSSLKQFGVSIHDSWIEREFIVVELSTEVDLVKYTKQKDYPFSFEGWFCDEVDTPVFMFGLYSDVESDRTQLISIQKSQLTKISTSKDKGHFKYYIIMPVLFSKDVEIYGRPEREGAVFYKKYNLVENPKDICFGIGGSMFGVGFESNIAALTKGNVKMIIDDSFSEHVKPQPNNSKQ